MPFSHPMMTFCLLLLTRSNLVLMDVTVDNEKATLLTFVFSVVTGLLMGLLSTLSWSTNTKMLVSLFSIQTSC